MLKNFSRTYGSSQDRDEFVNTVTASDPSPTAEPTPGGPRHGCRRPRRSPRRWFEGHGARFFAATARERIASAPCGARSEMSSDHSGREPFATRGRRTVKQTPRRSDSRSAVVVSTDRSPHWIALQLHRPPAAQFSSRDPISTPSAARCSGRPDWQQRGTRHSRPSRSAPADARRRSTARTRTDIRRLAAECQTTKGQATSLCRTKGHRRTCRRGECTQHRAAAASALQGLIERPVAMSTARDGTNARINVDRVRSSWSPPARSSDRHRRGQCAPPEREHTARTSASPAPRPKDAGNQMKFSIWTIPPLGHPARAGPEYDGRKTFR